jgi:hypothetical protein
VEWHKSWSETSVSLSHACVCVCILVLQMSHHTVGHADSTARKKTQRSARVESVDSPCATRRKLPTTSSSPLGLLALPQSGFPGHWNQALSLSKVSLMRRVHRSLASVGGWRGHSGWGERVVVGWGVRGSSHVPIRSGECLLLLLLRSTLAEAVSWLRNASKQLSANECEEETLSFDGGWRVRLCPPELTHTHPPCLACPPRSVQLG